MTTIYKFVLKTGHFERYADTVVSAAFQPTNISVVCYTWPRAQFTHQAYYNYACPVIGGTAQILAFSANMLDICLDLILFWFC